MTQQAKPTAEATQEPSAAAALPDYLASPNAVFADEGVQWRYGKAPDYSKTRKVWEEGMLSAEVFRRLQRCTIRDAACLFRPSVVSMMMSV